MYSHQVDVSQITIIFTKVNYSQSAFLAHTLQCLHVDSGNHNGKLSQLWCSLSLFTFCSYWILVESFSGCSIAPNRKTIGMSGSSITIMSIFFQGYFLSILITFAIAANISHPDVPPTKRHISASPTSSSLCSDKLHPTPLSSYFSSLSHQLSPFHPGWQAVAVIFTPLKS